MIRRLFNAQKMKSHHKLCVDCIKFHVVIHSHVKCDNRHTMQHFVFQTFVNWTAKNFLRRKRAETLETLVPWPFHALVYFEKVKLFCFEITSSHLTELRTPNTGHRTHFAFLHFEIILVCVIQWMKTFSRNFTFQRCVHTHVGVHGNWSPILHSLKRIEQWMKKEKIIIIIKCIILSLRAFYALKKITFDESHITILIPLIYHFSISPFTVNKMYEITKYFSFGLWNEMTFLSFTSHPLSLSLSLLQCKRR